MIGSIFACRANLKIALCHFLCVVSLGWPSCVHAQTPPTPKETGKVPDAVDVKTFMAELPGILNRVDPCKRNNAETCVWAIDYNRQIPELEHVLNFCALLTPELAAKLPENYQKSEMHECFGGVVYLAPKAGEQTMIKSKWLGVSLVPSGPLSDGRGFDVYVSLGTLADGYKIIATPHIKQYHSTPEQVARILANLPPGTLHQ